MTTIRDIKRRARGSLHSNMSVPALYTAVTGATPVDCTVRVWTSFAAIGQPVTGGQEYADRQDVTPKIRFLLAEIPAPRRGAVVSVETGEAYRVDHINAVDDEYVTAEVTRLTAAEAAGLPVPE